MDFIKLRNTDIEKSSQDKLTKCLRQIMKKIEIQEQKDSVYKKYLRLIACNK